MVTGKGSERYTQLTLRGELGLSTPKLNTSHHHTHATAQRTKLVDELIHACATHTPTSSGPELWVISSVLRRRVLPEVTVGVNNPVPRRLHSFLFPLHRLLASIHAQREFVNSRL